MAAQELSTLPHQSSINHLEPATKCEYQYFAAAKEIRHRVVAIAARGGDLARKWRDVADGTGVMGRRDEPKLDELKRLLRRLETMEADPKPEGSRKPVPEASAPSSGYVGTLRGAGPVDAKDERAYTALAVSEEYDGADRQSAKARSSGAASIVIGATTAAVVSSLIAVGLVMWTGREKSETETVEQRLNFVAPSPGQQPASQRSESEPAAAPAAQSAIDTAALSDAQSLLQRADLHIRNGNLFEARRLLEQAAKQGSGVAALTLGAMYDPARVAEFGNLGVRADLTLARAWYERAKALGVVEANERLSELATR
jgi:hypothetical protein